MAISFALVATTMVNCGSGDGDRCGPGSRLSADSNRCELALPDAACGPGQIAMLGESTCQPVGWSKCPAGFEKHTSGWACRGILPSAACIGATMTIIGDRDCRPIGDCAAPFPPADATHFVDDSYTAGQIDSTHFGTISAAIAGAGGGAVIAVEAGSYPESLNLARPVTIVGRCAEMVIIAGDGSQAAALGINSVRDITVSGVTLEGHTYAATVFYGGSLNLSDAVVSNNNTLALYVRDPGSRLTVTNTAIRATTMSGSGQGGWALLVDLGARAELFNTVVVSNSVSGLVVRGGGSTLLVRDSMITDTVPNLQGAAGIGLLVHRGGNAELLRTVFAGNGETGIIVSGVDSLGVPSFAQLTNVVVRDTESLPFSRTPASAPPQYLGRGISVQQGGQLEAYESAIVSNREVGLTVSGVGTRARLFNCSIIDTRANVADILGRGVAAFGGGSLELISSAVVNNLEVGVDATEAGSRISLFGSLVSSTRQEVTAELAAHGVLASAGAQVELVATTIQDGAGVGVTVTDAAASMDKCVVLNNLIGVHAQDGVGIQEVVEIAGAVGPLTLLITVDTTFLDNTSRVGSGVLPLPAPLGAAE